MQAYFTDPDVGFGSDVIEAGSQAAYRIADAMLEARGASMTRADRDRPAALAASKATQAAIKRVNAQAGHTPGPWCAERTGPWDGWDGWEVIAKDGSTVCNGLGSQRDPIRAANAHLIAAAPELLEALELIANTGMDARQCMLTARAAIKKAIGDTP